MKRTPKIGEKVFIRNIAQYAPPNGTECKVTRAALGLVWVKPKHWRGEDLEIDEDDIVYIEPESLSVEERRILVERFVKPEMIEDPINLRNEIGFLKKLIKLYPNLTFWRNYKPGYQMKSLLWWFGKGKEDFKREYMLKTLDLSVAPQHNDTLTGQKIGEDVVINKKPKSIFDL